MFELRYVVRNGWDGPEQVLQFRNKELATDYSTKDHIPMFIWTEWKDVPTVDQTK